MARYGLPDTVAFCSRCVISNQRPNSVIEYRNVAEAEKKTIHFDDEGVCDACRVAEAKRGIDWQQREGELNDLCNRFRNRSGDYDCIVPGSGGKDSFYTGHILQTRFGMHPLFVTWAPHIYTDWGRRNLERWQEIASHVLYTPRRSVHRLLTRLALENLFHPFQPFMIGQKALAPKLAVLHNIPLVFYGENEAEYGNPKEDSQTARRHYGYYAQQPKDIHLAGCSLDDLRRVHGLHSCDLEPYLPALPESLNRVGVEVHYLGYYLKWHPQSCYYYAVENGGFECSPHRTPGTYSKYSSIDDKCDDWHYLTTYYKFGIGRATYDAAQEIRSGDITRDEGVALVKRFDGEWPERFERDMNEYLSVGGFAPMTRERWWMLIEKFKSPHLFDANNKLKHAVWESTPNFGGK